MQGQYWPEADRRYHAKIVAPTLLIHGFHDEFVTIEDKIEMATVSSDQCEPSMETIVFWFHTWIWINIPVTMSILLRHKKVPHKCISKCMETDLSINYYFFFYIFLFSDSPKRLPEDCRGRRSHVNDRVSRCRQRDHEWVLPHGPRWLSVAREAPENPHRDRQRSRKPVRSSARHGSVRNVQRPWGDAFGEHLCSRRTPGGRAGGWCGRWSYTVGRTGGTADLGATGIGGTFHRETRFGHIKDTGVLPVEPDIC